MIQTIVLDCGHVLAKPAAEHWLIPPNMNRILPEAFHQEIMADFARLENAFRQAYVYLKENHLSHTREEEYLLFTEFYRRALSLLDFPGNVDCTSRKLAQDMVYNDGKFVFFDDVYTALADLKKRYRLCLLSDTWPSLHSAFETQKILEFFDGMILSCDYGITKERVELFERALRDLQLDPDLAVFVDDLESNLINAQKIGLHPVLMDRYHKAQSSAFPIVHSLAEIEAIL